LISKIKFELYMFVHQRFSFALVTQTNHGGRIAERVDLLIEVAVGNYISGTAI